MANNLKNQIKFGSLISFATVFINIVLGLIYTPWILKEIGSSNYGLYTLATTAIALFLLDFGMSSAVTRYISNYRANDDIGKINSFVGFSIKFYASICSIISIILIIVYTKLDSIYTSLTPDELSVFRIVFIIVAFFIVICFPVNICNGILTAYEKFVQLKGTDLLNRIGTVIVTVIALLLGGGLYSLVIINGAFNLVAFIVKALLIKIKTPIKISFRKDTSFNVYELISFSVWSSINSISQQMVFNLIPSILAMVTNTFSITLYGFANIIEGYVYNITQAINGFFMPSVSRIIVNQNDAKNVLPLMIKVGRINQSIISLLLIGLTLLGREFVLLWVGEEYYQLFYCILLVCFSYLFSASQQIGDTCITVLNKVKYQAIINLITGLLNLIGSYFIASHYGVVGVCGLIGAISLLRCYIMNAVYYSVLKINIITFIIESRIKMYPAIVLTFLASYFLLNNIPVTIVDNGWLLLVFKAVIITIVYFAIMWLMAWNTYEKELIKSIIKRVG